MHLIPTVYKYYKTELVLSSTVLKEWSRPPWINSCILVMKKNVNQEKGLKTILPQNNTTITVEPSAKP